MSRLVYLFCRFENRRCNTRAYRKNDQAWIEQKNGSVVRRFAGHDRYSGQIAGQVFLGYSPARSWPGTTQ